MLTVLTIESLRAALLDVVQTLSRADFVSLNGQTFTAPIAQEALPAPLQRLQPATLTTLSQLDSMAFAGATTTSQIAISYTQKASGDGSNAKTDVTDRVTIFSGSATKDQYGQTAISFSAKSPVNQPKITGTTASGATQAVPVATSVTPKPAAS